MKKNKSFTKMGTHTQRRTKREHQDMNAAATQLRVEAQSSLVLGQRLVTRDSHSVAFHRVIDRQHNTQF